MVEVRVNVKFSNATDVVNARRGLIPRDQVRTVTAEAVVDTGAVRSSEFRRDSKSLMASSSS